MYNARLKFFYGVMSSGKSAALLQTAFWLERQGHLVEVYKPMFDDRDENFIRSRIGLERKVNLVREGDCEKIYNDLYVRKGARPHFILADECQFFSRADIESFARIVDDFDIGVWCYGLRSNINGELFRGSAALFALADEICETNSGLLLDTDNRPITMHIPLSSKSKTESGVAVGNDSDYASVSRVKWRNFWKKND